MNGTQPRANGTGALKAFFFSALACLIFFGATEGLLRAYVGWQAWRELGRALPPPSQRNAYQQQDADVGYTLTPGYNAGGIHINKLGLRGPEIEVRKPPQVGRIVAMGDSTTFGLAGEHCPFPARLQSLLNESSPGRFQVVNAGVEGYSLAYARKLFEHRIRRLSPDVVTVYIGWNDIYSLDPFNASALAFHQQARRGDSHVNSPGSEIARMLNHLYLAQFIRRLLYVKLPRLAAVWKEHRGIGAKRVHPDMADAFAYNLGRFIAEIRSSGATPILMTLPSVLSPNMSEKARSLIHYPVWADGDSALVREVVEKINGTILEVARRNGVVSIDNAKFFDSAGIPKENLFFDTLHMYCEGNELLARNMAQVMRREAIVE